ncbi:MAG: ATPase, T2SS/T4P/T4SS family [Candidatus Dojkabacteria bacterium]|uniref:Flp pilus assembly complex ATPase component TadA n=1 Tax=Candidatus Dojkabacteria bacterium TaxID=2099670 RepID=A0A952AH15_9BACT|nr:Flp pilus assembly complex ATPase component TadA [Candidatus Dojkabacteria bacterium]WKZ28374.1 MAG: ATPase, T2SS/T4P/T4SS family [Candidatus Dojkabacteria bacterium]
MKLDNKAIRQILLKGSYISEEELVSAEKVVAKTKGDLLEYLLSQGIVTKDLIGQAVAESLGINYADLNTNIPSRQEVLSIPKEIGKKYRVVQYVDNKSEVVVATDDPTNAEIVSLLKQVYKARNVKLAYALPEDIDSLLVHYREPLETRFKKIIEQSDRIAPDVVVEIIDDAIVDRASDIHFEPQETEVIIRIRIDGVLQEAARIEKKYYENILNLIKVNAHMRIDEHASAQDGSMRIRKGDKAVDMRVSVIPTLDGEKITIRILSEYVKRFSLSEIGLSVNDQDLLIAASKRPFGMILVTGPTGSGKTSTLYSVLRILNNPGVNVTTIEDPVEYKIKGVNHIQVNTQTNLTFAKGLRSIVRQDPDVILVGEIRDEETAEIAVNAALTGHLLLSTFHANDAATAIPRLRDMGVESFLLASTLELIVAQRLVRKICQTCRISKNVKRADLEKEFPAIKGVFSENEVSLYEAKGCAACHNSGYIGRSAIFEFINMTREMKDLILADPSTADIWRLAVEQGAHSMFEDGIVKVKQGITTIEEVLRVAPPVITEAKQTKSKTK